jgi:hypothetical protein
MKSRIVAVVLLLLCSFKNFGQADSLQARVILIGDAGALVQGKKAVPVGQPGGKAPVVDAVRSYMKLDKKTVIVYLGDNLYKEGLPNDQTLAYSQAKAVLDSQVNIAKGTGAKIVFIPGNHDWNNGGPHGWEAVLREEQYINILSNNNVRFFPGGGCPGPVEVPVSEDVVLIVMDSQWWLHEGEKPGVESDCPYKTEDEVLTQLEDLLQKNSKKLVIFACHHPFKSYGIHGGNFNIKQHIFPLTDMNPKLYIPVPILGSIYPITRAIFGTYQDLSHPAYQNMINSVTKVLRTHPNVINVAGHEHTLQVIKDSSHYYIVSGAGCKSTRVNKGKKAEFAESVMGFATLEITKNKDVDAAIYAVAYDSATIERKYNSRLFNFSALPDKSADTVAKTTVVSAQTFEDSILVIPNQKFNQAGGLKRLFLGSNYRKEWATPVKLKVFDLTSGGYKIKSIGGGKQTKTLTITDKQGINWVIRTVNKDASHIIPEAFRNSLAEAVVQDFISGSHPYAPMIVAPLADKLKIAAPHPQLYFVPDDPAFGIYRPIFKNQIVTIEKKDPSFDNTDTKSSFKIFDNLLEDNDNRVDQKAVLRARLLDMLLGDFDRHFDQWKFGVADTGKGKLYYPIPKDRDQALYRANGLLNKWVSGYLLAFLKGFRYDIPDVKGLNWPARDFDRLFLNQLSWNDWQTTIKDFQATLTNDVLADAVNKIPREVKAVSGDIILAKLKSRRDKLLKSGEIYYKFLAKNVNVLGSNKKELFKISPSGKGSLHVQVFKRNKETDSASLMYDRTFTASETKEVRFYGFNSEDVFDVDSNSNSRIKLRFIGGRGNDTFNINGSVKNYIYDVYRDSNYVRSSHRSKVFIDDDPARNDYKLTGFQYNVTKFPTINLGYNADDKLLVGVGFQTKTYGFRKEPYATFQKFTALYASTLHAYQMRYTGEFNEIFGKKDLIINTAVVEPSLNNFFGLGNETQLKFDQEYYHVRYNYIAADILLRKRPNGILNFTIGPSLFHYWNHQADNKGKILYNPAVIGLDSVSVYSTKTYLGGKAGMEVNYIDNNFMPTRGVYWNTEFTSYAALHSSADPVTKIVSDMTVYGSWTIPAKTVAVLKLGGGHIFNKEFEYFQSLSLGQNNFLRGFRKNRFSGRSLAYGSLELRQKLFGSRSFLFPGDIGVIGFTDLGRVWMENEDSKKWHTSYGAGLYFAPFNIAIISATVAFSNEETLFNIGVGTRLNLTF